MKSYIDKTDLYNHLDFMYWDQRYVRLSDILIEIRDFPAIDLKPVVYADWETDTCHFYCSNCGEYVEHKTKYCPNCGARMREDRR